MIAQEKITLKELMEIVRETARRGPVLEAGTPLNMGPDALTLLEIAEVLVRTEEKTGLPLKTDDLSREWFSTLEKLCERIQFKRKEIQDEGQ